MNAWNALNLAMLLGWVGEPWVDLKIHSFAAILDVVGTLKPAPVIIAGRSHAVDMLYRRVSRG